MIREEIRTRLKGLALHKYNDGHNVVPMFLSPDDVGKLLTLLDGLGVVMKVKCSNCEWGQFGEEPVGMTPCYSCNSTGYVMEPLIEGVD